jgi:23S rRNA (adenine-C8)-methyltransferase
MALLGPHEREFRPTGEHASAGAKPKREKLDATSKYVRIPSHLAERGEPAFRYRQVLDAVFKNRIGDFAAMKTLPLGTREALREAFGDSILSVRRVATAKSSQAEKSLLQLPDGRRVEAVALAFKAGWESFCISSQAGCGFACSFCATGKIGLLRNMTADEITDQVLDFHLRGHVVDSVAFMGMGEALSNKNIFEALDQFVDPKLFGLSPRRITVSTIGVIPMMHELSRRYPQINLTLSLHSPFDEQRSELIPLNRKYPIRDILEALDAHVIANRRKTYIAYILIDGVNDTIDHARALASLISKRAFGGQYLHVSLVRYNTAEGVTSEYQRPQEDRVKAFHSTLIKAGIKSTIRASFGNDIDAACGQLYARYAA